MPDAWRRKSRRFRFSIIVLLEAIGLAVLPGCQSGVRLKNLTRCRYTADARGDQNPPFFITLFIFHVSPFPHGEERQKSFNFHVSPFPHGEECQKPFISQV